MECRICYETVTEDNIEVLECIHSLCQSCLGKLRNRLCPFCRTPIGGCPTPPLQPDISLPRSLHINMSFDIAQPRRRRRRRAPRRRISPGPRVRAPLQLSPSDIDDLLNNVVRPSGEESKREVSVSDRNRQCRRDARNRWRLQHIHNDTGISVR